MHVHAAFFLLLSAGEYCPEGTQEETWLSLVACELDPMSSSPVAAGRTNSSSLGIAGKPADASLSHCKGFKACPAGSYCPDTATATSCEPGRYCPEGSITSQPCNITVSAMLLRACKESARSGVVLGGCIACIMSMYTWTFCTGT